MVRVGGAHLHLCLDGAEPPVSVHLLDFDAHDRDQGLAAPHHDVDMASADDATGKFGKVNFDLLVLFVAATLIWILFPAPRQLAPGYDLLFVSVPQRLLLPPLRGPPR
jgi:hypothetical protein